MDYCCFPFRVALPSERRLRAPRSALLEKCRARGDRRVGVWDHAEHAPDEVLEQRFSAGSSGGAGAAILLEVEIAVEGSSSFRITGWFRAT
jgi:hypothetical protein